MAWYPQCRTCAITNHLQSYSRQRKSDERLAEVNETYPESSIDITLHKLNNTAGRRKVVQTHLSSDSVTSGGKQLGDTSSFEQSFEPSFSQPQAVRNPAPLPPKLLIHNW